MGGRLAGVGIGHATGNGPGRLEGCLQQLRARGVGGGLDRLRGEPRVEDAQLDPQAAADAVQGESAVGVGRRRRGPARLIVDPAPPALGSLGTLADRALRAHPRRQRAADRPDRDLHARDAPALGVDQAALDDLLGLERDLGGRLILVGVEVGPAHAVAGGQRRGAELGVLRRRGAGRVEPEPARTIARRMADRGREDPLRADGREQQLAPQGGGDRRVRDRLAFGIEDAADDEHPAGGGLRGGIVRLRGGGCLTGLVAHGDRAPPGSRRLRRARPGT